jgi:hypothetical protein
MKLCKTCKWWKDPENEDYKAEWICNPHDQDTFEKAKMPFEVKMCYHPGIAYFERNPSSSGISLVDGSEYYAMMCTGENFGCVNHEDNA